MRSTWAGGSSKQAGDAPAAIEWVRVSPLPGRWAGKGLGSLFSLADPATFHLPFFYKTQLFRSSREEGGKEVSGTATGLDMIQTIMVPWFPGGPVVGNLPCNARDAGSIPDQDPMMPQGN